MALYINTNIASLDAQNNLSTSQMSLQTSLQRLSSGLRINSAKDDAAGLAISTRMTSQIQGLAQASQNANDGISMSQTAEGGMSTIADNLQRMRTLAVQAANGSNSTSDRQSIQAEIAQLQTQINQVATETQYNGTNLLDGSLTNAQFQIGSNANQTLNMSIGNLQASNIGSYGIANNYTTQNQGAMTQANTAFTLGSGTFASGSTTAGVANNGVNSNTSVGTITISGNGTSGTTATTTLGETADQIAAMVNSNSSIQATGVTATASTSVTLTFSGTDAISLNLFSGSSAVGATPVKVSVSNGSGTNDLAGLVSSINSQSGTSGITATFNQTAGTVTLSNTTGQDIGVQNASTNVATGATTISMQGNSGVDSNGNAIGFGQTSATGTPTTGVTLAAYGGADTSVVGGQVNFSSPSSYSVTSGGTGLLGTTSTVGSSLNSVNSINVDTVAGANSAIQTIDAALLNVNNQEANMGAVQNRFTSVISNLATSGQNLTSARSLIQDTNFASETANLTRAQILQQAGTAMLAQANSTPNGVMALLK